MRRTLVDSFRKANPLGMMQVFEVSNFIAGTPSPKWERDVEEAEAIEALASVPA
jgi:hypothetical protein